MLLKNEEGGWFYPRWTNSVKGNSASHCEFDLIWTTFELFLKLYSHISILWRFYRTSRFIWIFVFCYRTQKHNLKITGNLFWGVYKVQMHVDLFFDDYFNFLSIKTEINRDGLNLKKLEGSEVLKTWLPAPWLGIWLNHFKGVCHSNSISTFFEAIFSWFSIMASL